MRKHIDNDQDYSIAKAVVKQDTVLKGWLDNFEGLYVDEMGQEHEKFDPFTFK